MTESGKVVVGREATPTPPNVGTRSLGQILELEDRAPWRVLGLVTPRGRRLLTENGMQPFPVIPGLGEEALQTLRAKVLVIEARALAEGPWSGTLTDVAPELTEQLTQLISTAFTLGTRVYWSGESPIGHGDLARAVDGYAMNVRSGSELYDGNEEGAPSSRLVNVLRELIN